MAQEAASRRLRRRPVARHIDRSFSLARLGHRHRWPRAVLGRCAVLDHPVQADGQAAGHGRLAGGAARWATW
jgi:hypothetical protein